ncbi:MAG: type III pantothenate kinase, partial [Candidatus Omnitrophica bacterium]|nr:type III pantothenate kinase [Candidatus Omnitrophota bacterium]
MRLLAVDIGNTNINFGIFKENRLAGKFKISTRGYQLKELKKKIGRLKPDEIIISSVVPRACDILRRDLKGLFRKTPYVLGKDITAPVKNLYRHPKQVGQDRLVNAYAGIIFYGAPLVVVDFGTAVTFDVILKNKEYLGEMMLPGLGISLYGLS